MRSRSLAACAAAAVLAGAAVPAASATVAWYWDVNNNGVYTISPGGAWLTGPAHNLTSNLGFLNGSACVGAINVYGGTLAGAGVCGTWGPATNVMHPYDGTQLRDGAIYPYGSGTGQVYSANESY